MNFNPIVPTLLPLCRATVLLAPILTLGETPNGLRRIIHIVGGHFEGERMKGVVLQGGADWQIVRANGTAILNTRYLLQTQDGALIYVQNDGVRRGPPNVLAQLARGEAVDPALYYMRTTPKFETADPRYLWLNDVVAVGSGIRQADAVVIDFFELM